MLKKSVTRFLDRIGSKVVSGMADTSSDAPNSFHKPKRQVYKDYVKSQDSVKSSSQIQKNKKQNKTECFCIFLFIIRFHCCIHHQNLLRNRYILSMFFIYSRYNRKH